MARNPGAYTIRIPRKALLSLGIFASVAAVTFLSFISLPLAIVSFGFISVGIMIFHERVQRQFWEQAIEFKLKKFAEQQDVLKDMIERQSDEIKNLNRKSSGNPFEGPKADGGRPAAVTRHATTYEALKQGGAADRSRDEALRAVRPLSASKGQIVKPLSPAYVQSLPDDGDALSDMVVGELLGHALSSQRVDVFLQPIARLPQRKRRFYEIFARVRAKPGVYIPAGRYKNLAEQDGVMPDIDTLLLDQCLSIFKHTAQMEDAPPFFMNITRETLKNPAFMGKLLAFLPKNRDLASRLVFEIRHEDFLEMPIPHLKIVGALGKLGIRFSLDHVMSLDIDVPDLQRFNVRFVKAPVQMFLNAKSSEKESSRIWKYKRLLEGNGIGLIVEKIEKEREMRELLDFEIHYGQGFLFGRPDVQGAYEPEFQRKALKG